MPNGEYRVQVNGNVTTGSAALPDAAVGNKIYLFGGMISAMGLYSPWWARPTGNPTLGSPWYFSKDKQKVLDMFHYSPWCGIGPNLPAQDDRWLDSCPTECEHDGGSGSSGLPDNYLQAVYTGVECDVTNYSNLNWDII
mgnify:FL=1